MNKNQFKKLAYKTNLIPYYSGKNKTFYITGSSVNKHKFISYFGLSSLLNFHIELQKFA